MAQGAGEGDREVTTPFTCPDCGGSIELVTDGQIGEWHAPAYSVRGQSNLRIVLRLAPFAACTRCEWCQEVVYRKPV